MNKKQIEYKKYKLKKSININDRKEGCVKVYPNNNYLHELVKFQISYKLKKEGYLVFTECRIKGGRADVCVVSPGGDGFIIELLNSESEERFNEKLDKYDLDWTIIKVNCKEFKINKFKI